MRSYWTRIVLVSCGLALSALLDVLAFNVNVATPGAYLIYYLFPSWRVQPYPLGMILSIEMGTDIILFFLVLMGCYLIFTRLFRAGGKND